ncbi:D-tyrosyl-tRNA(Tyr) deacylase [Starmerella bacillaris]|uniref:D-aminoacyl-tRNA deacylase n=1 Tax=Starmerella bacillaris TaxID=1247836 RepID=A0AAV5RIE6_STABA|nr:D-tyrosyl-tRNA(Tyr) deacylase [Starmerella bacillaris]
MRAIIQRVKSASVTVDENIVSQIEKGLLVLIGVSPEDTEEDCKQIARKITSLRLWPDSENNQWKKNVGDLGGKVLCVSQFTLYGKVNKGNKPDFHGAAKGEHALSLYNVVKELIANQMPHKSEDVKDGVFGAMMDVALVNDGPVTIQFDTKNK